MKRQRVPSALYGVWSMATALLADPVQPIAASRRSQMAAILLSALEDMAKAPTPMLESWRDLTDAANFLQSALELGLVEDPQEAVAHAKLALIEAFRFHEAHGHLRMTAAGLSSMRNAVEQFDDLIGAMSQRAFWSVVKRSEKRIGAIYAGRAKPGDVVMAL